MLLGRRRAFFAIAAVTGGLGLAASPCVCLADEAPTNGAPANGASEARRHFENGRALYGHGAYRDALAELQAAHALDPSAKDLVFNLGVVEEKLGDIDEAVRWFHAYTTMTLTPQERDRADAYVRRLEGARQELERTAPASSSTGAPVPTPATADTDAPAPAPPPKHGRIDAATLTTAGVAVAALAFGVVLGTKAAIDRPSHFVTGVDGSYADLLDRVHTAHEEAIAADVGFAVAIAAGVAATVLYVTHGRETPRATRGRASPQFGRRGAMPDDPASGTSPPPVTVSAAPLTGGGGLFVQGSF